MQRAAVSIDRQRAEFLRSCRARIKPADLGLPVPQRKRTEGLRREDVAALSGVSVSWYTSLEQGRDMRVSDEVLERICQTFKLSEGERTYLFSLVQHRPPRLHSELLLQPPPEIVRMLEGIAVPAVLMNLTWDVLAWNELNTAVFRDYAALPQSERNLASILFTRSQYYPDPVEFEDMARRILAMLRFDYGRAGGDPAFETLIRRLQLASPLFKRMWRSPEINPRFYGMNRIHHPVHGDLTFEHTSYMPDGFPAMRVTLCLPSDARTHAVLAKATAELRAKG